MIERFAEIELASDRDVARARRSARAAAEAAGLREHDPTRFATAISEVARNAVKHGGRGVLELAVDHGEPRRLLATVRDHGPGIADIRRLLDRGTPGLTAARRLVDELELVSALGAGTTVVLTKRLPPGPGRVDLARAAAADHGAGDELQRQDREIDRVLEELRAREAELERLTRELEDTNRGVLALYAELDQRAELLARASETKSRFLSFMSHELRTPLAAVLSLTELLLARADGPLTSEQEHQVTLIRRSSETLSRLVEDLLDLAKVEAGKLDVRPSRFEVTGLFAALRGIFKAVPRPEGVEVVIEDPAQTIEIETDEDKLAQILRNLLSNALKFTEKGSVALRARREGPAIVFECTDTGIGIAREDQERIFGEFEQIDSALQRRVRGTGLGLSLSRRLAELLGGTLELESEPGRGSTFRAVVAATWRPPTEEDGHDR